MSVASGVGLVLCACHANLVTLEWITSTDSGRRFGFALTFFQFLAVGLLALPFVVYIGPRSNKGGKELWTVRLRPLRCKIRSILLLSFVFWIVSSLNNIAFNYKLSVPVHSVFRSSSLVFNIIIGYFFFHRRFTWQQIFCAAIMTLGMLVLTISLGRDMKNDDIKNQKQYEKLPQHATSFTTWLKGMSILLFTSVVSPLLGHYQDECLKAANKKEVVDYIKPAPCWAELLCLSHLFAVPFFSVNFLYIVNTTRSISNQELINVGLNIGTQYFCIRGVYTLTDVVGTFGTTFTLTVRKSLSLIFSVFYFGHYKTLHTLEWSCMLFIGFVSCAYPFLPKAGAKDKFIAINRKKK